MDRVRLLRRSPIFAPLPLATIEWLSSRLIPVHLNAGETLFRQGEHGDRFYLIEAGELEVSPDGSPPKVEGPGEALGEIALLRDIPRTASVRACTDAELYALERDDFLGAVTGHAGSAEAAEAVIGARLGVVTA